MDGSDANPRGGKRGMVVWINHIYLRQTDQSNENDRLPFLPYLCTRTDLLTWLLTCILLYLPQWFPFRFESHCLLGSGLTSAGAETAADALVQIHVHALTYLDLVLLRPARQKRRPTMKAPKRRIATQPTYICQRSVAIDRCA